MQGLDFQYNCAKKRCTYNGTIADIGDFRGAGAYKILAVQAVGFKLPEF